MPTLHLLPAPKSLPFTRGHFLLPPELHILLGPAPAAKHIFAAERFAQDLAILATTAAKVIVSPESVTPSHELRTHIDETLPHEQAYRLIISKSGIDIQARSPAGTFYAFQTLTQILRQTAYAARKKPLKLPCLTIDDHPDFPHRGVYHDCARGKVPTLETLLQLIDDLAGLKINELQLYVENNFEFRKHPQMYDDTTPFTAEEMLTLDAACRARHIDFIPSLTSLGHFEKILRRPAFRQLSEAEPADLQKDDIPTWCDVPWTLCTTDPAAQQLLKDMYDEFLPNFTSPAFNICCDESWDLGKGRSKKRAAKIGTGQMYVDWINYCNSLAKTHGRRIQMWGDIILNHPDLLSQLPEDATLLEWGYEAHHDFDTHCALFAQRLAPSAPSDSSPSTPSTRSFYVCPGTSSWLTLASRTRNAFGNIHAAATAGLKHGAVGLLNTDWGDIGHQQFLAVSLTSYAYSAAASWNLASVPNPASTQKPDWSTGVFPEGSRTADRALQPFLQAASLHLFNDPAAQFATLAYELGLTYERIGWQRFNGALEWYMLREKWDFANYVNCADPQKLPRIVSLCEKLLSQFEKSDLLRDDADILRAEMLLTIQQIIHGCQRTLLRQKWLAADPLRRNPEHQILRAKPPQPLPKSFPSDMKKLAAEARQIHQQFQRVWLARNKPSRLADIDLEFIRLQKEYTMFAKKS